MKTILAPHWQPYHRDGADANDFRWWQPPVIKIVTNDEVIPYLEDIPAGTGLIVRHYPSSDSRRGFVLPTRDAALADLKTPAAELLDKYFGGQGSGRDLLQITSRYKPALRALVADGAVWTPEQAAAEHVAISVRMAQALRNRGFDLRRVWFEGLNEPMLWSIEPPELIARYERARILGLTAAGLQAEVLNAGVGWPGNGGVQNAPVAWDWFQPVIDVWSQGHHLGLHEYWYLNGPGENWRWWAGRYEQCPFDVAIDITEAGIDCGVVPGQAGMGWLRLPESDLTARAFHYLNDLAWYEQKCLADGRVRSICIFTYDGVKEHWGGFNIRMSDWLDALRAWLAGRPELTLPAEPVKPAQPPPVVVKPEPAKTDKLLAALQAEFGDQLIDLRGRLPTHPTLRYPARATATIDGFIVHHTAVALNHDRPTNADTWRAVAAYHVSERVQGGQKIGPWPGIGYAWGVDERGNLYLLNGLDVVSNHCGGMNVRRVGIAVAGNYQVDTPSEATKTTLLRARQVLETYLGKALIWEGHRDRGQTACPGDRLYAWLHAPQEPPQVKPALRDVLLAAGAAADLGNVNPPAALHRAILAAGYVPTSPEVYASYSNGSYVCQVGRKPGAPPQLFYCPVGHWDQVLTLTF